MGVGVMRISRAGLASMLNLPDGYTVWSFQSDPRTEELFVQVGSAEIPSVDEGVMLPVVTATYHRRDDGYTTCTGVEVSPARKG